MDVITQGALGAACAQAVLHPYDKRNAWLVGALAGMAADLDVFIRSSQNPALFFLYHRLVTHSLIFIPVGACLVTLFLLLFKRFRHPVWLTFTAAFIGYATHALLDACTSYGTVLYWPFTYYRVSWDLISIIDPFFTFPVILGLVWTLVFDNRKGVVIGLFLASLVLLINTIQHKRALTIAEEYGQQHQMQFSQIRVLPKLTSSTYWRFLAYTNNKLFIGDIHVPLYRSEGQLKPLALFPAFQASKLPAYVHASHTLLNDYEVFRWFTDGYLITARHQPLLLVDARYLTSEKPLTALWGIQFEPNQPHVKNVRFISLEIKP